MIASPAPHLAFEMKLGRAASLAAAGAVIATLAAMSARVENAPAQRAWAGLLCLGVGAALVWLVRVNKGTKSEWALRPTARIVVLALVACAALAAALHPALLAAVAVAGLIIALLVLITSKSSRRRTAAIVRDAVFGHWVRPPARSPQRPAEPSPDSNPGLPALRSETLGRTTDPAADEQQRFLADDGQSQVTLRSIDAAGRETAYGLFRVRFESGGQLHVLHWPWHPPFRQLPRCFIESLQGPESTLRITNVEKYGLRAEIKLRTPADNDQLAVVQIWARENETGLEL